MTCKLEILEREDDLDPLYPMIKKLANLTKQSFIGYLSEVVRSFSDPNYITFIEREDGEIKAYICGYFLNQDEFYVSQIMKFHMEKRLDLALELLVTFEGLLKEKGAKRILGLTILSPEVFEKYGFKFKRYLINKEI
jgi:hypothetical protein